MKRGLLALAMALCAGVAQADPVDEATAKRALFGVRGVELALAPDAGLTEAQAEIISKILGGLRDGDLANYYGSVAVSPDFFTLMAENPGQAVLTGLMQVSERLHSPAAADKAALRACNEARIRGQAPCVVAGRVLPRRFEDRALTLSVNATRDFRAYRRADSPKAFAVSRDSRSYALSSGEGAVEQALENCNLAAPKADCYTAILD